MNLVNYIGTKLIRAVPMNREEYNKLRGWKVPKDENPADEGYLVEYPDSESNHKDFAGYVSWSPKAQFEVAYTEIPFASEEPFVLRAAGELVQLVQKVDKLGAFLKGKGVSIVSQRELDLLNAQYYAMCSYRDALSTRIGLHIQAQNIVVDLADGPGESVIQDFQPPVVDSVEPKVDADSEPAPQTSDEPTQDTEDGKSTS